MAVALKTPEIALSEDEQKTLAKAVAEVNKHYPLPVVSDKQMAIAMLVITCISIYGGKLRQIKARKSAGEQPSNAPAQPMQPGSVFTMFSPEMVMGQAA